MQKNINRFLSTILISAMTLTSIPAIPVIAEATNPPAAEETAAPNKTISDARSEYVDEDKDYLDDNGEVKISGVITETSNQGYAYIQDSTGALGLKIAGDASINIGDKIEATGTVGNSYGFGYLNVTSTDKIKVIGSEDITPELVNLSEVGEDQEAALIRLENVTIESGPQYGEYVVKDGNSNFRIKPKDKSLLTVGTTYKSITGVVYFGYGKYALAPRSSDDIVEDNTKVKPIITSLESGDVRAGQEITLSTETAGAKIYYTLDGSTPSEDSTEYTAPIAINEDTTLKAIAVLEGFKSSDVITLEYKVLDTIDGITIPEIQGRSHTSPYDGKAVVGVEGIVTSKLSYKFDRYGDRITGFYVQDENGDGDDATSDAIFVRSNADVNVGDKVAVSGAVKEYVKEMDFYAYDQENQLSVTSIIADNVAVLSSDNELPAPVIIGENGRKIPHDKISSKDFAKYDPTEYAIDFYESLEGMLVKIEKPLVVSAEHNRVLFVAPDNGATAKTDGDMSNMGGIVLGKDDVNTEIIGLNGAINSLGSITGVDVGATTDGDVTGILDYEWGSYQVYITEDLPEFTNVDRAVDTLKFDLNDEELTIGSYNVYNHGGDDNEKSLDKAKGIASNIVNSMKSPDIIGLVEVQDNDGAKDTDVVDAGEVYEVFIKEIKNLGGPEYQWVDIPPVDDAEGGQPGGNIRVGYLYNPERVSLKEGATKGGSTDTVGVDKSGHLTLNPGRIAATDPAFEDTRKSLAAEFTFKGQDVIVIANHLSSKGGDNATYGNVQPAVKHSEVNRIKQAQLINDFVDDILAKNPKANVVALGDFNDFQFSEAIDTVKGAGKEQVMVNSIDMLPKSEQYTYSFGGNSQVLDNILVTNNLEKATRVDVLNINSILSDKDKARRFSDHDPVVVSIDLDKSTDDNDNQDLKDLYVSTLKINNILNDATITKGDAIKISAGYTPYKSSVEKASATLKLYKVGRKGKLIPVFINSDKANIIDLNEQSMELTLNTTFMPKGKYLVKFEVFNKTDGTSKLSDEATMTFKIEKKTKKSRRVFRRRLTKFGRGFFR